MLFVLHTVPFSADSKLVRSSMLLSSEPLDAGCWVANGSLADCLPVRCNQPSASCTDYTLGWKVASAKQSDMCSNLCPGRSGFGTATCSCVGVLVCMLLATTHSWPPSHWSKGALPLSKRTLRDWAMSTAARVPLLVICFHGTSLASPLAALGGQVWWPHHHLELPWRHMHHRPASTPGQACEHTLQAPLGQLRAEVPHGNGGTSHPPCYWWPAWWSPSLQIPVGTRHFSHFWHPWMPTHCCSIPCSDRWQWVEGGGAHNHNIACLIFGIPATQAQIL